MAKQKEQTFTPSIRTVEKEYGETGVGQTNRLEVEYQLGFEVDGAFVRMATVTQAQVDAAVAKHERAQAAAPDDAEPEPDDAA